MGVRTPGLDIAIVANRQVADDAARAEAKGVVERWNEQLSDSRDMLWSPTIRAALIAGMPWLEGDRPPGQGAHPRRGPADGGELRAIAGASEEEPNCRGEIESLK